ncbi:MAG: hypothetical protein ABIZ80_13580 [Bryobacteraceae bacterium]
MPDSLVPYTLLSLGLVVALTLCVSLKRDLNALERKWAKREQATAAAWESKVTALEEQYQELSEVSHAAPPAPAKPGINLNTRAQALQLFRRGESPERIASALSLPTAEVELLIRVHQIVMANLDQPAAISQLEPIPPDQLAGAS